MKRNLGAIVLVAALALTGVALRNHGAPLAQRAAVLFADDFEAGLDRWSFPLGAGHELLRTPDPARGTVLSLQVRDLPVYALMKGSESWGDVRIEGLVQFPEDVDNYLGFIYRYVDDGRRIDFGSFYIKGNGSYVQANPHSDTNVGRTLYPEVRTTLEGPSAIEIGRWKPFALEVAGSEAHLYVGDLTTPQFTLRTENAARGAFGFKPRNPGGSVWLDDIRVTPISGFSYKGPPLPNPPYRREQWLTQWRVLGPLEAMAAEVEASVEPPTHVVDNGRKVAWRPLAADSRGAVHTGRVVEYRGSRKVAYFHATVTAQQAGAAMLELASIDDVAIWWNGTFLGFASRQPLAWWDAGSNPRHPALRDNVTLRAGDNHLLIRVVGGVYATGGFFARVAPAESPQPGKKARESL